jgi:hypothetical protein
MKRYVKLEVLCHAFLTLELDASEWSGSRYGNFALGTEWIEDWVGPRSQY